MPDQGKQKTVDLEQLKPLLESGYTVLTPNFRMARSISAAWNQAQLKDGCHSWPTVKVSPLEAWLQGMWQDAVRAGLLKPLLPANSGQMLELWQEVIAGHERDTRGYNLLRPTAAAEQASRARDTLLRWQVDLKQAHHRQNFELDEDCATFFQWHTLFEEKLAGLGMVSPSDCLVNLLACAESLPRAKLALVGFDEMPPLLRACVLALGTEVQEMSPTASAGECLAYEYADKRTELAAVARWAKELSGDSPQHRIGIILPDMRTDRPVLEYLLRREFDCLGANYTDLPVNFSTGVPLDQVPMIRDALLLLGMTRHRVALNDVVALFQSRFHQLDDVNSALAMKFLRRLFDSGTEFIESGDLRHRSSRIKLSVDDPQGQEGLQLGQVLMTLSGMRELRRPAQASLWADRFSDVLELWGWPGKGPLDSIEYQQLQLWYSLLEDFAGYDAVCDAMPIDAALQLLGRCCARQVSQPQTPDSNIQVLGLLEAAGLPFDSLWICDMQAGNWPAAARPNPFIPVRLQRDMNMPNATAQREWLFASGLMSQYVHSASYIYASYASQRDGVPEKYSALLEDFKWQPAPSGDTLNPLWLALQRDVETEELNDYRAPSVEAGELASLGGGSGLIEDQSQCPFKAFARRRLGISPLGEAGIALSAAERGSLLHDALYHLWGALGDSATLAALNAEEELATVGEAVGAAIESLPTYRRGGMTPAYFELEASRLCKLLVEWLAVERQRSTFQVVAREQEISLKLERLTISLRADRIDELPDGARFIIDYKSGKSTPQDWLGERPAKPQLLLYGLATKETIAGLAFAQLRRRDCKYTGAGQTDVAPGVQSDIEKLVKNKMTVKDWEDLAAQWQDNLQRLAREFLAGDAQVDPLNNFSCTYCGLQPLCRVAEQ
ncbi:MAG: PD-(D/E)XK nuclease family protein [Proteobacteria bacterium]|nr:PD-(D/E)XK nuclease family protein [Pseudomonadota bacterium]